MDGRKLPSHLENPVDNVLLAICRYIHPWFHKVGFTANGITILSGLLQFIAIIMLYFRLYIASGVIYLLGYLLDVLDGYYARMYKMVSSYGDKLDHGKDTLVTTTMFLVVLSHKYIPLHVKALFFVAITMIGILTTIYVGCQETYYHAGASKGEGHATLAWLKKLCTRDAEAKLRQLRWGGTGSASLFIAVFFVALHWCARR